MLHLSETKNAKVRFELAPHNYTALYNRLKQLLGTDICLFAKPLDSDTTTNWYFESNLPLKNSSVRSYNTLSQDEKYIVSELLEDVQETVIDIIRKDSELGSFADSFMQIPDKNDIKFIEFENESKVVLTQWACQGIDIKSNNDPVRETIEIPKTDREQVDLYLTFSDGTHTENFDFSYEYETHRTIVKQAKTDSSGCKKLGKFKFGSKISVYQDPKTKNGISFVVQEGKSRYDIVLPIYTDVTIQVVNRTGAIEPDIDIRVKTQEKTLELNTGDTGKVIVPDVCIPSAIEAILASDITNGKKIQVSKSENVITLIIQQPEYTRASIKVVNQLGEPVCEQDLNLSYTSDRAKIEDAVKKTNVEGVVNIDSVLCGSTLIATEKAKRSNTEEYKIAKNGNDFVFKIKDTSIRKIQIIDNKKKPLLNHSIKISIANQETEYMTDSEGFVNVKLKNNETADIIIDTDKKLKYKKLKLL